MLEKRHKDNGKAAIAGERCTELRGGESSTIKVVLRERGRDATRARLARLHFPSCSVLLTPPSPATSTTSKS